MKLGRERDAADYIDHGAPGVSVGDVRIVRWRLFGSLTDAEADMHVIATVVGATPGGGWTALDEAVIRFANGTLRASGESVLADPADTTSADETPGQAAVLGGTGAFAGARGTMESAVSPDGRHTVAFSIACAAATVTVPEVRLLAPQPLPRVRPVVPPPAARPERPLVQPPLGAGPSRREP